MEPIIFLSIGMALGVWMSWRRFRWMRKSIHKNAYQQAWSEALESRREAMRSGIDTEPRPDSGPAGIESNLFDIRPGVMMLNHLAESIGSATLNDVTGSQGQSPKPMKG